MVNNIKQIIWIAASQLSVLVVNLILLKIITQELSIEGYGFYALCMTIILFIRQIVYDPFSMVVAKQVSLNLSSGKSSILEFSIVKYAVNKIGILIIIFALVFLIFDYIFFGLSYYSIAVLICSLYLLGNGAQGVYLNILNSLKERKVAALILMLDIFIKISMVIMFVYYIERSAHSVLASVAIGSVISFLIIQKYLDIKNIKSKNGKINIGHLFFGYLKLTLPVLLPAIFNSFKSVSDRWFLTGFIGLDGLAAYSVLLQIGYFPIILIFGIAQTYLGPIIYEMCIDDNIIKLQNFIVYLILSVILIALITGLASSVLSSILFEIIVGKNYKQYSTYLPFFAVAASITAGAAVMQNVIFGYFNTKISSLIILLTNLIGIFLAFMLIYFLNFIGAAIGLIIMGLTPLIIYSLIICNKWMRVSVELIE